MVFFISAVLITLPLGYAYNSIVLILFVLYSLLSAKKGNVHISKMLLLPMFLYGFMVLSLLWSIDIESTLKALSKEAALLFVPLAFFFNRRFIRMGRCAILKNFSRGMVLAGIVVLARALIRYILTGNTDVFFYHELATRDINAIYLSALFSVPLFWFLTVKSKSFWNYAGFIFLFGLIFLLASKTVIIVDVLITGIYLLFYTRMQKRAKITMFVLFMASAITLGYYGKVGERLVAEFTTKSKTENGVNILTVKEAWETPRFTHNDYFNGSAFRIYQIRIFTELLTEEPIVFTGYGLNASPKKVYEKGIEHNVSPDDGTGYGYGVQNFHNQYVETFADLGIFGFLLLLLILGANLKKAFKTKDFIHIAFAILMIALLLTESFLWRQRGIVFFTMLYCLFNGLLPKGFDKERHEKNTNNGSSRLPGVTPL